LCLRLQVEPNQMGPIRRVSLSLLTCLTRNVTSRKVVGSSLDEVNKLFFNLPNLFVRIMVLGFTQHQTEMSTRRQFLEVKRGRRLRLAM
jgi:hypothetical protein